MKKILILGVNGFIGHHLTRHILEKTTWEVYGMDTNDDKIGAEKSNPRFHFYEGDITINREWTEYHIKKCDVVIPLVAIATPAIYISDPLSVFELDFEANLPVVRAAVRYNKHLIFPSTSEVYGMSNDEEFDSEKTSLVYGPICKSRWIYACAKQMMDRVIFAYGQQKGLRFTLIRPFNWIGPRLDSIHATKEGSSRVVTQFLGHIMRGETIKLISGGEQRRCFTYISDGIDALLRIIENPRNVAEGKIYNIGNPENDFSVFELAEKMIAVAKRYPEFAHLAKHVRMEAVSAEEYYGVGYQDSSRRVPNIMNTTRDLGWTPTTSLDDALILIFDSYRHESPFSSSIIET